MISSLLPRLLSFLVLWLFVLHFCVGQVTRRALVIGLGEQEDVRWGKIHGDNDIPWVAAMLCKQGYSDIKTLKNKQATKQSIVKAFRRLAQQCKKGDRVYIHYSGHGQLMTDLNGDERLKGNSSHSDWDESWIPYDAYMTYGPKDRGEKHLCDDEVADLLRLIRRSIGMKGTLIVSIDACHSGDATCGDSDECVRGVDVKFNIPRRTDVDCQVKSLQPEAWLTISACKPWQLSTEIKGKNVGRLTYSLSVLGKDVATMSPKRLSERLLSIMQRFPSRLPQTPMVTGKK